MCTELSSAYTRAVSERLPNAALVVDHFHVTKLMNEKLDLLRRQLWHEEKDINKRKVIKGTRWFLLKNGNDIFDYAHKNRLENALSLNRPLMIAYYWGALFQAYKHPETAQKPWMPTVKHTLMLGITVTGLVA